MKINCQSCGAKYTIADDKVRGRTVKIRCKKCSSAIVVKGAEDQPGEEEEEDDATRVYAGEEGAAAAGYPAAASQAAPQDLDWTVTLDDGSQQGGSLEELRALYTAGRIHPDCYVWRDGMSDWQPLRDTPELFQALTGGGGPSKPPRPRASTAPAGPDARMGGALFGGGGGPAQAARVDHQGRDHQDLFGAPQQPPEEEVATSAPASPMARPQVPKFTAERGENSVLFTIDTVMAVGNKPARKSPSVLPEEEKVDFRALASVAPPAMDSGEFNQSFDPPPSFGGPSAGTLAAPMLPTTIEPEPIPEPEPMPMYPYDAPPKSNKGLIVGLGVAVALLLVVSIGFGGYLLFGSEEPLAANTASAASAEGITGTDDKNDEKDETADKADAATGDNKDDKADAAVAEKDDKKDETAAKADSTAKVGGPLPTGTSTAKAVDPKAADTKTDTKKDEPKAPEVPAATADRKFSRSAAVSALNAAAGAASGCKKPGGPTGRGRVSVTFAPSGRVTTAVVNGAPFAGTSVGGCVAGAFRRASVPPFDGSPVTVHKSFSIN
jgi:predicted Zn finger-like uncharacterized protein